MSSLSVLQQSPHAWLLPRSADPLTLAMTSHQSGGLDEAEALYRQLLDEQPRHAEALHYLGVLLHQRGKSDDGASFIRRALSETPRNANAHCNLGNIHKECGELAEAEVCYWRALELAPAHPQAIGNLAVVLQAQGCHYDASQAYRDWLKAYPGESRAHYLYGRFLCDQAEGHEDIERALVAFRTAFGLDEGCLGALEALGVTLYGLGRTEEAAAVYRDWSARDPENPIPQHMLAACGAAEAPARAANDYVRELFDRFAASFDEQLIDRLGYRAPQALRDALALKDTGLDVLDAGCGTGLCGKWLRAHASRLIGVDLSAGMLAKAQERGEYDALVEAELTAWLQAQRHAFDLIVSADTLVYFGDLETVCAAMHGALRGGGRLAFSLEAMPDAAGLHQLGASGRYRHSHAYITGLLERLGFVDIRVAPETLRKEAGRWVDGWVVVARRAS